MAPELMLGQDTRPPVPIVPGQSEHAPRAKRLPRNCSKSSSLTVQERNLRQESRTDAFTFYSHGVAAVRLLPSVAATLVLRKRSKRSWSPHSLAAAGSPPVAKFHLPTTLPHRSSSSVDRTAIVQLRDGLNCRSLSFVVTISVGDLSLETASQTMNSLPRKGVIHFPVLRNSKELQSGYCPSSLIPGTKRIKPYLPAGNQRLREGAARALHLFQKPENYGRSI